MNIPLCWICGAAATTGEHKIKRSDLIRVHGKGDRFASANLNYLKSDDSVVQLRGPNSEHLKYPKILCAPCNNVRSQPWDQAYDTFIAYVEHSSEDILAERRLDFEKIFSKHASIQVRDLYKYFIKAFGCRIADAGGVVPDEMCAFLKDAIPEISVSICFAVSEDELVKPTAKRTTLKVGHIHITKGPDVPVRFAYSQRYRWLLSSYWFNWLPLGPVGEPWAGHSIGVDMGSFTASTLGGLITREDGTQFDWPGIE